MNNTTFSQLLQKYQTLESETKEKSNEIVTLRAENNAMKRYIKDLENQVSELKRELRLDDVGALPSDLEEYDSISKYTSDGQGKRRSRPSSQGTSRSLSRTKDFTEFESQELKSEIQRLSHQIEASHLEVERLQDELILMKTVSQENVKLRIEINHMHDFAEFLLKFVEKSCTEGEKAAIAQLKVYENELKISYEERTMKSLHTAYNTLEHTAKTAIENTDKLTKTIEADNTSLEYILTELNNMKSQNENLRRESEARSNRLGRKRKQVVDLKKELSLERERNEEYSELLHKARMEQVSTSILKAEISSKTSALGHLEQQYKAAQKEIKKLKQELSKKKIPVYPAFITKENTVPQQHNSLDVLSVWNATYNEYAQQKQKLHMQQTQQMRQNHTDYIHEMNPNEDFAINSNRDDGPNFAHESDLMWHENDELRENKANLIYDINTPRQDNQRSGMDHSSSGKQNSQKQARNKILKKPVELARNEADQNLSILSKSRRKRGILSSSSTTSKKPLDMQLRSASLRLLSHPLPNSSLKPEVLSPDFGARYLIP